MYTHGSVAPPVTHWRDFISKIYRGTVIDITDHGFFSISSVTKGHDIHHLLDENFDHYWQSHGKTPQFITIEFPKKEDFLFVLLYLDYGQDRSYTPQEIIAYLGPSAVDLKEFRTFAFFKPTGWQIIDLRNTDGDPSRGFVLELKIEKNHESGADSRIRAIRVIGPTRPRLGMSMDSLLSAGAAMPSESFEFPSGIYQKFTDFR